MKIDAEMKRVFTAAYKQGVRDALERARYVINSYIDPKIRRNNLGCCDEYALDQFELCREEIYELEADLPGKG